MAHIIRRYLGSKTQVEPDFRLRLHPEESDEQALANQGTSLLPGDRLLLCSDGLTDLVDDQEIQAALEKKVDEATLHQLIDLANERGGHDNITIVAIENPEDEPVSPKPFYKRKRSWLSCLIISIIIAILLAAAGVLTWYITRPDPTPTPTITLPVIFVPTEIPPTPTWTATHTLTPLPTETATPDVTYTPWPTDTQSPTDTPTHTLTPEGMDTTDEPSGGSSP